MMSKTLALGLLLAYAEARFGQEQVPVAAIQALSNFGNPGEAATLAGAVPGVLLAAANACAQVELADQIVATLGNDQQVIDAAKQLIAAEKNFNPFAVDIPSICDDATLPATEELRGVIPIVDPAVAGSDVQNANSATSLTTPFNADGLSIADISIAQGFDNFTAQASDGSTAPAGNAVAGGNAAGDDAAADNGADNAANDGAADDNGADADAGNNNNAQNGGATQCGGGRNNNNNNGNGNNNNNNNNNNGNNNNGNGNNNNNNNNNDAADDAAGDDAAADNGADNAANDGAADDAANDGANNGAAAGAAGLTASSNAALDFGTCNPAMSFVGGRANRAADEFTFNSVDPAILAVQQEALNPNIITNRICDEVQNRCGANDAAIQACLDAKADLLAQDVNAVKVAATATNWNTALGFENVDIAAIDGGVDGAANDGAADDAANDGAADDAANDGAADDAANDGAADDAANDGANNGAANDGAADDAANDGANNGAAAGTAALDFGTCNPAMSFIGGRGNRAADEFTFNSVDPAILAVQQEALNPNIITNRICDEVQNRCGANDAAIQACLDAKADLLAQDINAVKVAATATNWNTALGFGNVDISQETA